MVFSFQNKNIQVLEDKIKALEKQNSSLTEDLNQANLLNTELSNDMSTVTVKYNAQEELNKLCLQSADLVNQIRESLANSSSELIVHRDNFQSSQALFDQINDLLALTVVSTEDISTDTKKASHSVDQLQTVVSGINDFVNIIKGISDQTNLLALNAAIEAARCHFNLFPPCYRWFRS